MFRLPARRFLPFDAEPGEVFINAALEFRRGPRRVDILDPKQQAAARFVRQLIGSYSNVVGLPLFETAGLLAGQGFARARRLPREPR